MIGQRWTEEETIVALYIYCQIPFGKIHTGNSKVIDLSKKIDHSVNSVAMKLCNFANLDPDLTQKGLKGTSKLDKKVFDYYYQHWDELAIKAEEILKRWETEPIFSKAIPTSIPEGKEREVITKQRINQRFFSDAVKASYDYRCCISGVGQKELLDACHIVEWAEDEANRTNPSNGLCMTPFFHRAYDTNLMAITPDYEIIISDKLIDDNKSKKETTDYLASLNHQTILLPSKFYPDKALLDRHYQEFKL